jgi:membrane-associated phospholipid phosphatase
MHQFIKQNRDYFLMYFTLLITTLSLLILVNKGDEVIWLNQFYTPNKNVFFVFATKLGEEWVALIIGLIILFTQPYKTVLGYLAMALTISLLTYAFKHFIFEDAMRPRIFLKEYPLNFVNGLYINSNNSFPSGHTAAAFSCFSYWAYTIENKWKFVFLIFPVLVGLSRVYLAQHFLIDVVAGSVLGVSTSIFFYRLFNGTRFSNSVALNKKLLK